MDHVAQPLAGAAAQAPPPLPHRPGDVDPLESMPLALLSPLLTLLDNLRGHTTPMAPSKESGGDDGDAPALWDLSSACSLHLRFLDRALASITSALDRLGLALRPQGPVLGIARKGDGSDGGSPTDQPSAEALTDSEVLAIVRRVEAVLDRPPTVRELLVPTARDVTGACTSLIRTRCVSFVPPEAMHAVEACVVQPAEFFNEPWSVGMETAWMASGAEGMLLTPNYDLWTEAHLIHRCKSWRGVDVDDGGPGSNAPGYGRIWRFEYWECLRTPCHEVIHLVQHALCQTMPHQVAEHDGAFSTYVLMLAVCQQEEKRAETGESVQRYYPGAVEEAMLESLDHIYRTFSVLLDTDSEASFPSTRGVAHAALLAAKIDDYTLWRDAFGVVPGAEWRSTTVTPAGEDGDAGVPQQSRLPFGGSMAMENLCKNIVALEAVAPTGSFLEPGDEVDATTDDMLATFFCNRTDMDCTAAPVDVRPGVRLSDMAALERVSRLIRPAGAEAACKVLAAFDYDCSF